jgi:hypothetical protein
MIRKKTNRVLAQRGGVKRREFLAGTTATALSACAAIARATPQISEYLKTNDLQDREHAIRCSANRLRSDRPAEVDLCDARRCCRPMDGATMASSLPAESICARSGRPTRSELRRSSDECLVDRPFHSAFVKGLRQQGQSPSIPLARPMNAVGWGIVMIALKASGSRCA